jgi:membrane protease YdiL (CAAX protease family)
MQTTPLAIAVLTIELAPAVAFGFAAIPVTRTVQRWPTALRLTLPAILVIPYVVIAASQHMLRWQWLALYAALPVAIAWLLTKASRVDPRQLGNWRDALILLALGVAVDLRWLDSAWPHGLESLGKLLLVDAGLYGFLAIRQLDGTGFDFRLRWLGSKDDWKNDWKVGFRELLYFAPFVLALGLTLGFLHPHANYPAVWDAILRWAEIFVFVAIPEELFFRAWVQNLLERRVGRRAALVIASVLFGLSHFNKRNPVGRHFNLPYVILATIAGIFYGRAWRQNRHVPASTITHTCVDWLWSFWF